jgi:hypothetical protein
MPVGTIETVRPALIVFSAAFNDKQKACIAAGGSRC